MKFHLEEIIDLLNDEEKFITSRSHWIYTSDALSYKDMALREKVIRDVIKGLKEKFKAVNADKLIEDTR